MSEHQFINSSTNRIHAALSSVPQHERHGSIKRTSLTIYLWQHVKDPTRGYKMDGSSDETNEINFVTTIGISCGIAASLVIVTTTASNQEAYFEKRSRIRAKEIKF